MTDEWGIDHGYQDALGRQRSISSVTIDELRQVIGAPPETAETAPVMVRRGDPVPGGAGEVILEDGTVVPVTATFPADLPFGYHRLRPLGGRSEHRLVVTPGRCHLPPGWRAWGWAVQLYATRSRSSWGIGDLGDLARLNRWSAGQLGAGFVLVNPLLAAAPTIPQQASPYFPASRRFRNPLYLRVEDVPGAGAAPTAVEAAAQAGRALNQRREIVRDEVWRIKLAALEAIWEATGGDAASERWRADQGSSLTEFATWCALAERYGPRWRSWPAEYQDPHHPAVARFAAGASHRIAFFAWLQWLLDRQLAGVGSGLAVIQDLPIGVDPDGADTWAWPELLAPGVTVGSPPDELNTQGQDWGLAPFVPWRLRHAGYEPFIDTIRASLAWAGGLRIDHVMGLFRLWWIPAGAEPDAGAYVRYPAGDLLDIVALESHRAGAVVVGEDLGTVEPEARQTMAERNMLSYRLLWFEADDPAGWPERALAAVTTHDLPTVAGLWDGSDLATQRRLGLEPNEAATEAIRARLAVAGGLDDTATPEEAAAAAHRLLARAPSTLLCATLDDALAEPERPNMPGADTQRPNWCLALPVPLEEIEGQDLPRQVATTLSEAITQPPGGSPPPGTERTRVR